MPTSRRPGTPGGRVASGRSAYAAGVTEALAARPAGAAVDPHLRSANLDIVRALAALAVLTGHAYLLSGQFVSETSLRPDYLLITNMSAGVWLFFALSGYLIAGPFISALHRGAPLPSWRGYVVRRATRIYPLYLVAFPIAALLGPTSPINHWWQWPVHLLLLQNIVPEEEQAIVFVSWTLAIEVLFYLAVPVVAAIVRKLWAGPISAGRLAIGVVATWVASLVWTAAADAVEPTHIKIGLWLRFVLPATWCMFCPGLLVAVIVLVRDTERVRGWWNSLRAHPWAWIGAAAILALAACVLETRQTDALVYDGERIPFALASGILVALAVALPERHTRFFRLAAGFGLISYGIYLWQGVILGIIEKHHLYNLVPWPRPGDAIFLVHWAYFLALTVPVAVVSWFVLERPALSAGRRLAQASGSSPP